jgi:hypothetical protein
MTSGAENTLFGYGAGNSITTGNQNTIVGSQSGSSIQTNGYCTIIGRYSGASITTGSSNVIAGRSSGNAIVTGSNNTLMGDNTAPNMTGSNNTIIGYGTAGGLTSGSNNTIIGASLGSLSNPSNTLILGANGTQLYNSTYTSTSTSAQYLGLSNGQIFNIQSLTELTTIAAAASTNTTIQLPANAVILGVSTYVQTAIPGVSTYTAGDSGNASRYSTTAVSGALGSSDPGTKAGAYYNSTAASVVITPNATPSSNTGRVRTTIHYYTITAPTS